MTTIFTIGHSDLAFDQFLKLLKASRVDAVADVRSSPYSGRAPWFSRNELKPALKAASIQYVFLGNELGGRPSSNALYKDGVANYEAMADTPEFEEGIQRLLVGSRKHQIALMCSERDPLQCHRFLLVSKYLSGLGVEIVHIAFDGTTETQAEAEQRLLREVRFDDLLAADTSQLQRAYAKRSSSAAYTSREAPARKKTA